MKKLWFAVGLIASLSVLLLIALVPVAGGPSEPEYHGRKLTRWLDDLHDPSTVTQANAELAIQEMGTNAVPFLVQMLYAKDSRLKMKCMGVLGRQHWVDFHFHSDQQKHIDAFRGLMVLGPDAKAAIPDLADLLKHGNPGDGLRAASILSRIGPSAVPALESALTDTNRFTRLEAAQTLGVMGEPSFVSNLLALLQNPDWITRVIAARALSRFPDQANVIVPALIANLNDTNGEVRGVTVVALGSFGESAKPAVPQILKVIEENKRTDANPVDLYNALSNIDPQAAAKLNGK